MLRSPFFREELEYSKGRAIFKAFRPIMDIGQSAGPFVIGLVSAAIFAATNFRGAKKQGKDRLDAEAGQGKNSGFNK
jgi:hypothetical protein